ncbi:hypothetical protein GCM10010168_58320 [Actinoplanes ianthinogenes]|uniref:Integral membrane protein n=1 Tax=Actinoplanes ianthinogenes TaxID=122358 RepID=A0ABN6CL72_9ACTN|nr:hypothetical protein [Actinoplanes ianthinogenes]BCJ45748.1 hypothetical protein Aiant_64050 [Actinoplanes ianthinogenes]GGR32228.1 hypothetical protein GCM10010168_58320 [Actinoplanes ianthinogenes]
MDGTAAEAPADGTAAEAPVADAPPPEAPVADAPPPEDDAAELARLRAEVLSLRAELGARPPRRQRAGTHRVRAAIAAVLVAVAAFALVTSVVGLWAARTTLNTERWVATVAPLPQDPKVAAAVADYATIQLFEVVNVDQRLREVLPPQAGFVVGPLTGQLQQQVHKVVLQVLQSDRFQTVWVELNQRLHTRMMAVLNGTSDVVTASGDQIQIDLLPLINQALRTISAELPTLFGKQLTLPDLSSGEIPPNLREKVQEQLGVTLPANFAQFTVYDGGKLYAAQQAVATAKRDLALFVGATVLLLIAAYLVSPRRRRTTVQLGIWLVIAAVAVTAILRAVRRQILEQVPAGVYRDGVDSAMTTIFSLLRERGQQIIWIGALLALLAYLVGPGRFPVWLRRQISRGGKAAGRGIRAGSHVAATRGPGWIATHLDPLRIAGVVVAAVLALILSSWTSLLVILILLAAYEVAITLIGRRGADDVLPAAPQPGT